MREDLKKIFETPRLGARHFLRLRGGQFVADRRVSTRAENRIVLGRLLKEWEGDPASLRPIWNEEIPGRVPWSLPTIIGGDSFLRMYAEGMPLSVLHFRKIWRRREEKITTPLEPLSVDEVKEPHLFHDVKATPPGLLPKLFTYFRMKQDAELIRQIQCDLGRIEEHPNIETRRWVTLAILSCGASYRELDGKVLSIPSLVTDESILYAFRHHLIWEGVKTISATPLEHEFEQPGIYLCQGTEIWPSQPSVLGTLFANLGKEGAATEPYANAWRQIHRHLRLLHREGGPLPIVAGHSMGGSLATQIALYSHPLIDKAYAFNPPVVEERDHQLYHRIEYEVRPKLLIYANLDDLPFWRIGSKIIGKVFVLFANDRWTYRPIRFWEAILILPALVKIIVNLIASFPAHQTIFAFHKQFLLVPLSKKEVEQENAERLKRFDHLDFISQFHAPARRLLGFIRKHFGWSKEDEYLLSQLELLDLHEQDLKETLSIENGQTIKRELEEIHKQKKELKARLATYYKKKKNQ